MGEMFGKRLIGLEFTYQGLFCRQGKINRHIGVHAKHTRNLLQRLRWIVGAVLISGNVGQWAGLVLWQQKGNWHWLLSRQNILTLDIRNGCPIQQ